ncbi:hypothetical protein EV421DRAFT_1910920 [Armillaria borealis]|uniref:F-box domain-containing protein n=1 Tax=Armillaria borealis TaxID=47425 RepID=A0AA39IXQ0_9AGAR|nr:hypothetical protein EV421DRAFT_1910920 [Armillaria borealis]
MALFTIVDFDNVLEDAIITNIDAYNDGLTDRELLDHIDAGDHYYYRHMEHLTHVGHQPGSLLYRLLFDYHYLITESPTYIDPLLQYYIPDSDRQPSRTNCHYLPVKLWTMVFSLLARDQLPMLHLVCVFWSNAAVPLLFTSVRLQLPFAWQLSSRSGMYVHLANRQEIALVSFLTCHNLFNMVETITFSNWSFTPYCFFLHSFSNIHTIWFLADAGTPATIPHIPYPFLLPSSVRHLVIRRCSLHGHSVEGLLSPDTSLESLELIGLEHGAMYLPPVVGPMEIATWWSLTGVDGFRLHHTQNAPLPSLRRLCIDFSRNAILRILYHNDPLSSVDMAGTMLMQLFHTQSFRADMSPMLLSTQHFPLVLHCNMVTSLDVLVVRDLFRLFSDALTDVQFSLRDLVIRYPARVFSSNSSQTHISLTPLMSLQRLTIYTSPRVWHHLVESVFTWVSHPRTLDSSELCMIVQYEGNDYVLHSNLRQLHFERILSDPNGFSPLLQHFGGEFCLQLATQGGMVFDRVEYIFASSVLDAVVSRQQVRATVLPIEVTTYTLG